MELSSDYCLCNICCIMSKLIELVISNMSVTLHSNITFYTLICTDGSVVHSYGRLIPHEFPITDLQQISGPDGIGRINCTFSSGQLEVGGVSQTINGTTTTWVYVVNSSNVDSFQNRERYCNNGSTNYVYLYFSSASKYIQHNFQCTQPIFSQQVLVLVNTYLKYY